MTEEEFKSQYLQTPQHLKIGDIITLKNPTGYFTPAVFSQLDTALYEVVEFLDKGDIRIKEKFGEKAGRTRIVNSGRIGENLGGGK